MNLLEASTMQTAEVDTPCPAGLAYLPYQRAAVSFSRLHRNVLLADEQGLGKTVEALAIINDTSRARRVLIVCPATLKLNWKREAEKWLVNKSLIVGIPEKAWPDTPVVVVNYDQLSKWLVFIRATFWDYLILDEAHYLKSGHALRTKCVNQIRAHRKLLLTGTPVQNRSQEFYTLLKLISPEHWGTRKLFEVRYCGGRLLKFGPRYRWDATGNTCTEELNRLARERGMIRRLKADVLPELPDKRRQAVVFESSGFTGLLKTEKDIADRLALGMTAVDVGFTEMSKARHDMALQKVPLCIAFVEDAAADGHPIVVFCHHVDVLDALYEHFADRAVRVAGDTPNSRRQAAVDDFQAGRAQLFFGQVMAAGTGITLTRSAHVVFCELPWNPGQLLQAEDRCHRVGQHDAVLVQYLVVEGSLDGNLAEKIENKQVVIDAAVEFRPEVLLAS